MTDWGEQIAKILTALGPLVAAYFAWRASQTAKTVDQKTDAQTVTIESIDKKADEAVENTNSHLSKLHEQFVSLTDQYIATLEKRAAAPTIVVTPVVPVSESAPGGRRHDDLKSEEDG